MALDPIATAAIEELILELKKDFTVVIVTHSCLKQHVLVITPDLCILEG